MFSKEESVRLQKEFWDAFDQRTAKIPVKGRGKKRWVLSRTGIKGMVLKFEADKKSASVIWEIYYKKPEKIDQVFELLVSYKAVINEFLDPSFVWEEDYRIETFDALYSCARIYKTIDNVSMFKDGDRNVIFDFFIENMTKIEAAFNELQDILKEKI